MTEKMKQMMERAAERDSRLEAEKYIRKKIALELLEQCKREGLTVSEVLKTIEEARGMLEWYTGLDGGLVIPGADGVLAESHVPD